MKNTMTAVVLCKIYTDDFLSDKRIVSKGEMEKLKAGGHHLVIISKELFNKVQDCISNRKRKNVE